MSICSKCGNRLDPQSGGVCYSDYCRKLGMSLELRRDRYNSYSNTPKASVFGDNQYRYEDNDLIYDSEYQVESRHRYSRYSQSYDSTPKSYTAKANPYNNRYYRPSLASIDENLLASIDENLVTGQLEQGVANFLYDLNGRKRSINDILTNSGKTQDFCEKVQEKYPDFFKKLVLVLTSFFCRLIEPNEVKLLNRHYRFDLLFSGKRWSADSAEQLSKPGILSIVSKLKAHNLELEKDIVACADSVVSPRPTFRIVNKNK